MEQRHEIDIWSWWGFKISRCFYYSMHENRRWERWKPCILLKWYLMVFVAVNLLIQVLPWTTIVWHGLILGVISWLVFLRHRIACSSVHMASFFTTLVPRTRTKEVVKLMETPGNSWKQIYIYICSRFRVPPHPPCHGHGHNINPPPPCGMGGSWEAVGVIQPTAMQLVG